MANEINWGLLVSQGRAKDINVSWSDEEHHARYVEGIPAEYVRKGIFTQEEYQAELRGEETPHNDKLIRSMSKDELKTLATELGLTVPSDAKRLEIISLIHKSKLPATSE